MPNYDFRCKHCDIVEERNVPLKDFDLPQPCPKCDKPMERVMASVITRFLGTGWGGDYTYQRWPKITKRNYFTGHKTDWNKN